MTEQIVYVVWLVVLNSEKFLLGIFNSKASANNFCASYEFPLGKDEYLEIETARVETFE